ncbi:carotenoid biosynthesis protein [Halobacteriales archaeon QS_8_69_26]|nr:MAG: carotenoid biosynthesis protein [Halobacteriales archaeon QS_8_69_26]
MSDDRRFAAGVAAFGVVALVHAALTWPVAATVALFGGGALVAFVAEAVVIDLGWLERHVGPKVLGVPLYVLFGWTGTVYVAVRIALLVTGGPGPVAVGLAAGLATAYDLLTDHQGVERGHWTYTDDLPGPRLREVPWWNFAGWIVISSVSGDGTAVPISTFVERLWDTW